MRLMTKSVIERMLDAEMDVHLDQQRGRTVPEAQVIHHKQLLAQPYGVLLPHRNVPQRIPAVNNSMDPGSQRFTVVLLTMTFMPVSLLRR